LAKNKVFLYAALILFLLPALVSVSALSEEEQGKTGSAETPAKAPEQPPAQVSEQTPAQVPAQTPEQASVQIPAQSPEQTPAETKEAVKATEAVPAAETAKAGNVTINFKGADIRTVLAYISEVADVDIVAAPDVKGVIDLKLTDKPWKVALDIIVRNYGFAYEREGDIIRVVTLDKLKQEEVVTQTFSLNYGKAKDIVESIKKIVSARGRIKFDERTNMVIVTDIPTSVYKIGEIIGKLDKETSQVLIEARILETTLGDDEKLGIDWNIKFEASGAKRPTTFPFNYFGPGTGIPFLDQFTPLVQTGNIQTIAQPSGIGGSSGVTTTAATTANFPSSPAATNYAKGFPFVDIAQDFSKDAFKFGTLDFSQFSAVLEMLKQRSDTNIVSNPRIATLNNVEASIQVGQTFNMPKYERNSGTGKMEITGYEAKDLGIKLRVTPRINEKEEIVVELVPEIIDLVKYDTIDPANGIVAPVFSSRQANTKVMIKDGDTIFIGGLIKENILDVKKPVPFIGDILGDVPYVGLLFCKKEKTKQKTELIFFITVKLMKKGVELEGVPLESRTYVPNYDLSQEEWQKSPKKRAIK
jgi:type IV pilus assembly protein PilQ